MFIFGLLAAILMGFALGLVGGGGSILTVPILVYLFKVEALIATSYSLFIVGLTALVGSFIYFRRHQVQVRLGLLFGLPSFIGVFVVRYCLMPLIPSTILQYEQWEMSKGSFILFVFSILMLGTAYSMIRPQRPNQGTSYFVDRPRLRWALILGEGFLIGGVTGFVGAGGGFLIVPALMAFLGLKIKEAVGTSLMIIALKSFVGFAGDLQVLGQQVDFTFLGLISAVAVVGMIIGVNMSHRVSDAHLKKTFGVFILVMAIFILIKELFTV